MEELYLLVIMEQSNKQGFLGVEDRAMQEGESWKVLDTALEKSTCARTSGMVVQEAMEPQPQQPMTITQGPLLPLFLPSALPLARTQLEELPALRNYCHCNILPALGRGSSYFFQVWRNKGTTTAVKSPKGGVEVSPLSHWNVMSAYNSRPHRTGVGSRAACPVQNPTPPQGQTA